MKKSEKYEMISNILLGVAAGFMFLALITSFTYSTVDDNVLRLVIYSLLSMVVANNYGKKKLIADIEEIIKDLEKDLEKEIDK